MNKYFQLAAIALAFVASVARADYITTVTLNTSALAANSNQGPFVMDFQLNDGSGAGGDGNNTAVISNFTLTGGSLGPTNPFGLPGGGASGNLTSGLSITDSSFLNDFNQQFTPGSSLSFKLDLTTNVSSAEQTSPDEFSFVVYSNTTSTTPATVSQLLIDITGPNLVPQTSGGALGNGVLTPAPSVSGVPEPSTLMLSLIGAFGLAGGAWQRRRRCI